MATVNLLPNADVSNDWTIASGSAEVELKEKTFHLKANIQILINNFLSPIFGY